MWANNETGVIQPIAELARARRRARRAVPHRRACRRSASCRSSSGGCRGRLRLVLGAQARRAQGRGRALRRGPAPSSRRSCAAARRRRAAGPAPRTCPASSASAPRARPRARSFARAHARHGRLRERLWDGIRAALPDAQRNGAREHTLAHTLNVSFAGASGEALVEALDLEGIAVATGAACHAGSTEPSHVLAAMGVPRELGAGALRFSLGPGIDDAAIARVLDVLPGVVARVRAGEGGVSERWLVAMSGGVDSSVAAALLARAGHEVVGVTMDLGEGSARDVVPRSREEVLRPARRRGRARRRARARHPPLHRELPRRVPRRGDRAVRRGVRGRAHADPVHRLQSRAEVRSACCAAPRRSARAAWRRDTTRASRARPTAGSALFRPRDRDKDQTYFLFDLPRATLARVALSARRARARPRCARSRASSGSSPRTSPRARASASFPTATCAARSGGSGPRPRGRRVEIDERGRDASSARTAVPSATRPASVAGLGLSGGPWYVREVRPAENRLVVDRAPALEARARARCATRAGSTARRPTGPVRARCATDTSRVGAGRARARRHAPSFASRSRSGRPRPAGRGGVRRGRRARARRRVDHWRGRVSSGSTRCASASATRFARPELLAQALTHSSRAHEDRRQARGQRAARVPRRRGARPRGRGAPDGGSFPTRARARSRARARRP